MAINLKFDLMGNPELPSIVLANRSGNKLGQLNVNADSIEMNDEFNVASEFSFTLNKYIDDEITPHWDKVVDFKLVYCPEWDMWFEIKVELDEATETVKTVFCTQLGQAELSQIMLYNVEINTDIDIEREDYKTSILYDEDNPKSSILHRLLEKAPHYSIAYVDESIQRIQRQFSFDGISICDAFNEIAEEIGCLFVYDSNSQAGGKPNRTISVYDLQQNCNNKDCKHRGEFTDKCPKCGGADITYGYGEDTTIFVTADELATEGIQLVTDTDSVKNCFKLEGGDDLMTATIRNCNPNGTDYIWYFSDSMKEDMSKELVEKIESYDELYKEHYNNHISELDSILVSRYNALVEKYKQYYDTKSTCLDCDTEGDFEEQCSNPNCNSSNILTGRKLQTISTAITGYPDLMTAYYNTIDLLLYLESGLMPNVEMSDTSAEEQLELLTSTSLSPVAVNVKNIRDASEATAKSAVLSMAKVLIRPTYKVDVVDNSSSLSGLLSDNKGQYKTWTGKFIVTNYSDETDTATSGTISVRINNATETFIQQKINKALNKENTDDYSITGLFAKEYDDFCNELKKYALNPLDSFNKACDTCLSILHEQGLGNDDNDEALYNALYKPYFDKQRAINAEIATRQSEIAVIEGVWDKSDENNPECTTWGLQQHIEKCQTDIQNELDFEKYLGEDLWLEFCAYRREDKYSNSNYVSDGLNNAELFKKANEFIEVAEEEIFKSAELQHSISTNLNNLLSLPKFEHLLQSFKTGNWIRVQVDDKVYKLRLLKYSFGYGDSKNISVEFSDVTKIKNGTTDVQDILAQASSMASSYDSVQRQAKKGNVARSTIDQWLVDGLNTANVQIQSNDSEEVLLTKNGLLARSYDDITGTYSPEQLKITHNIMAYTDDNWETVSSALGKHEYHKWQNNEWVEDEDYGLSSKFVTAGYVTGSQIIGGEIVSSNYEPKESGTYFNLINGEFEIAGGKMAYRLNDDDESTLTLKNVTIEWANTNAPEVTVNDISGLDDYIGRLEDLEDQLDGRVQTYSQTSDPSTSWTETQKEENVGDLWFNPDDGLTKRWNGESWDMVTDSGLAELVQSKAQIFTSQPTPPYYVGDLWVQGVNGEIMRCIAEQTTGDYDATDWEKASKYTDDTNLNTFIDQTYTTTINTINEQLDKKAETWYQSEDPSNAWGTDELKESHLGDLWHYSGNTDETRTRNSEWIWQKVVTEETTTYQWFAMDVPDSVFDAIDGVASIYVDIPENPNEGDLLIPTSDTETDNYKVNKVYRYDGTTWVQINYTDDSSLNTFINGAYKDTIENLNKDILAKADTFYQSTMPHEEYDAVEDNESYNLWVGDLWYDTDDGKTYIYQKSQANDEDGNAIEGQYSYKWTFMNVPNEVFDTIDGIASIYVTVPSEPNEGDLLIPNVDIKNENDEVQYEANKVYRYNIDEETNEGTWVQINYTDDAKADEAYNLANSAKDIAENAKVIGDNLVDGLGFKETEITGEYVIAPVIAGGHLLIGDTAGTYAQIATDGKLTCTNADVSGHINATSLTLGDSVTISTGNISGLDDYAKKDDIQPLPENILYADDVSISTTTSANGVTTQSITVGEKTYTSIINGDFVLTNVGLGVDTTDGSKTYTCISKDGLLTAKNAIVYGTVYATDGEFTGDITANSLTLGNDVKISTNDISGLSSVATSGNYNDLNNLPTIPESVSDLGFDASNVIYKGDITQIEKTDNNGIRYLETSVPTSDGETITYSTYDANDYIVLGRNIGKDSEGQNYISVSKEGLLTARNAVIYGTVHATDGEFTGDIKGGTLLIGDKESDSYAEISDTGVLTAKGATIKGGTLLIGDKESDSYAEISDTGVLTAKGVNIAGVITATEGEIGRCKIVDGQLTVEELSAISPNLGTIKAGNIQSHDYDKEIFEWNQDYSIGLEYTVNGDGTSSASYVVTGMGSCTDTNLVIPPMYRGLPVTGIASQAFERKPLVSVTIPSSVQAIGSFAFYWCESLRVLNINDGVTNIGTSAFANCKSLPSVVIPNSVTKIGDRAFSDCSNLTSVDIGSGVTDIGNEAFCNCSNLDSIIIPNNVVNLGDAAFRRCSNLTSITIGSGVSSIGQDVFDRCTKISSILVNDNNEYYKSINGDLYSKDGSTLIKYAMGKTDNNYFVIPHHVTSIVGEAFSGVSLQFTYYYMGSKNDWAKVSNSFYSTAQIYYHSTERPVEDGRFWRYINDGEIIEWSYYNAPYSGLQYTLNEHGSAYIVSGINITNSNPVIVPSTHNGLPVTEIGEAAFKNCTNLTNIELPDSIWNIGDEAFYGCTGLISIDIPFSVGAIGDYAFYNCTNLKAVNLNYYLSGIGRSAFENCSRLGTIHIPNEVQAIGFAAFKGCSSLGSIILPFVGWVKDGTTKTHFGYIFGDESYASTTGTNVPSSLKSVTISCASTIGENAFFTQPNITSVIICEGATSISRAAFWGCSNLSRVWIPSSMTSIHKNAFTECTSLTNVDYGGGEEQWRELSSGNSLLTNATCECGVTMPSYSKNGIQYIKNADGITTAIRCFGDVSNSNGLVNIYPYNREVIINISDNAFENCSNLTSVIIPDSVTRIGDSAFSYCKNLTSVTIGNSVVSIGKNAFELCNKLKTVYYGGTEEQWQELISTLGDDNSPLINASCEYNCVPSNTSLYGKRLSYALNEDKISYTVTSIGTLSDATQITIPYLYNNLPVTKINNNAFDNGSQLTSIEIPNSILSIGDNAFSRCPNLTSIVIPNGVSAIGAKAFYNCSKLTSAVMPNSIISIGEQVLDGCSALTDVTIPFIGAQKNDTTNCYLRYLFDMSRSDSVPTTLKNIVVIGGSILSNAFLDCHSLETIKVSENVSAIASDAFNGCDNLVYNQYDTAYYLGSEDNNYKFLVKASNTSIESCEVNPYTKLICSQAFMGCSNLRNIYISKKVNTIGDKAFSGCFSLENVIIPSGVRSVGQQAFESCSKLLKTKHGLSYVDNWVVFWDNKFDTVVILEDAVGVADDVFHYANLDENTGLKTVYYEGDKTQYEAIIVGIGNEWLVGSDALETNGADVYYYSDDVHNKTSESNQYWCYSGINGFKISCDDKYLIDTDSFKVTPSGQITAVNGNFYGYIHATDGIFEGEIKAKRGNVGGLFIHNNAISSDELTLASDGYIDAKQLKINRISGRKQGSLDFDSVAVTETATINTTVETVDPELMVDEARGSDFTDADITILNPGLVTVTCQSDLLMSEDTIIKVMAVYNGHEEVASVIMPKGDNTATVTFPYVVRVNGLIHIYDHIRDISSVTQLRGDAEPKIVCSGHFVPSIKSEDDTTQEDKGTGYNLGEGAKLWNAVYARNNVIQSSDRNKKNTIQPLSDAHEQVFDALKPVSYKFNVSNNNRTHTGLIAQDVKEAVENAGLTTQDFAAYCEWENNDGSIGCGLRYSEFISLCIDQIQKLKKRVEELEEKLATSE